MMPRWALQATLALLLEHWHQLAGSEDTRQLATCVCMAIGRGSTGDCKGSTGEMLYRQDSVKCVLAVEEGELRAVS